MIERGKTSRETTGKGDNIVTTSTGTVGRETGGRLVTGQTGWAKRGFWLEKVDASGSASSKAWLTSPAVLGPERSILACRPNSLL